MHDIGLFMIALTGCALAVYLVISGVKDIKWGRINKRLTNLIDAVANGDGFTTEIRGVKIQKCDEHGLTATDYKLQLAQVYVDQERHLVDTISAECEEKDEMLTDALESVLIATGEVRKAKKLIQGETK